MQNTRLDGIITICSKISTVNGKEATEKKKISDFVKPNIALSELDDQTFISHTEIPIDSQIPSVNIY